MQTRSMPPTAHDSIALPASPSSSAASPTSSASSWSSTPTSLEVSTSSTSLELSTSSTSLEVQLGSPPASPGWAHILAYRRLAPSRPTRTRGRGQHYTQQILGESFLQCMRHRDIGTVQLYSLNMAMRPRELHRSKRCAPDARKSAIKSLLRAIFRLRRRLRRAVRGCARQKAEITLLPPLLRRSSYLKKSAI